MGYRHTLKSYTREDLEGKEIWQLYYSPYSNTINVGPIAVNKVTDKTLLLVGGGRIPIGEVGLSKDFGRLVFPKEDTDEIIQLFRATQTEMKVKQVEKLEEEISAIHYAKVSMESEM